MCDGVDLVHYEREGANRQQSLVYDSIADLDGTEEKMRGAGDSGPQG